MKLKLHRFLFLILVALFGAVVPAAAQTDTLPVTDTGRVIPGVQTPATPVVPLRDSLASLPDSARADTVVKPFVKAAPDTTLQHFYKLNPYTNTSAPILFRSQPGFASPQKDLVFYILTGLLLLLGLLRIIFSKYFNDLFRIFFQTNFRQKSLREQLLQNKMASLLLNIFFCISGGLFLYFVAQYKGWMEPDGLLKKLGLCVALVAVVYSIKYISLKISGWLFGLREITESYMFIVFLINKVVGVLLLPATIILALGKATLQPVLLVVAMLFLIALYLYRYVIALPLVRNHAGLTGLHFFIYLCAFEVVPVLLIYKLLLLILSR